MNKDTLNKVVAETNKNAQTTYDATAASLLAGVKSAQQTIRQLEEAHIKSVAGYAKNIADTTATLKALKQPTNLTAEEIFGAEFVAAVTS